MSVTFRTIGEDEADIRLDRWFRRHFPALTEGRIQKLCRTGQVRVDGRRADAGTRLTPGQSVRIPPLAGNVSPPERAPSPALEARAQRELERMVLYRDDALLVLAKPAGLPVQGGPGISLHLDRMLDGLRFGHSERPRLVHRLDRDTSGVLVLARTPGAAAKLAAAFRGRDVEKIYWAVVVGCPDSRQGRIDLGLVRTGRRTDRIAPAERGEAEAARAITDYRTLDRVGNRFAWLELRPLTGRMHQLRVHCAALGTPISGDDKYGAAATPAARRARGALLPTGTTLALHLHARRLVLPHPSGGTFEAEAELPPHLRSTFRLLGFTAPAAAPARRS